MDIQGDIEKVSLRIDELQAEIDKEKQNGNYEEARSLRGEKVALVNDRVELRKLLGQQQAAPTVAIGTQADINSYAGPCADGHYFAVQAPVQGGGINFVVPAFEADFLLNEDLLLTPLPSPVPMRHFTGHHAKDMDMNSSDDIITRTIAEWMDGDIGDGEEGIIHRNDALFRVYHRLARLGTYSRNKHEDSTVATTRSDRTDKYEGITLVKIEEKAESLQGAIDDLVRKANWLPHYALLPFIFGIAVTSQVLEIFKLYADNSILKIFSSSLTSPTDRWMCVRAMINIARTLKFFIEQKLVIKSLRFDVWHERNSKRIRLDAKFVEVEFKDSGFFGRMKAFYIATEGVHNLEHLYIGELGPFTEEKRRIRLVPVGVERKPDTVGELVSAVKQICKCLFELHAMRYVHCDVRWSNIIQVFSEWNLVDCEFACSLDEVDLLAIRSTATIKRRFVMDCSKSWSPLFDLYQVGLLLIDAGLTLNEGLTELRDHLTSKEFTAVTVKRIVGQL